MVKEKPNSTRTYDADGFRRRAACICVKDETEQEVLLVSGSRDRSLWVVPGGGIEPTEDPGVAALRECIEEAGVKGNLGRCLGTFANEERKTRTSVFVMVVTEILDDWDDAKTIGRKRKWFTVTEAIEQLSRHKPVQQMYLEMLLNPGKVT